MANVSLALISALALLFMPTPGYAKGLAVERVVINGPGLEQSRVFETSRPPHGRGVMPWTLLGTSWANEDGRPVAPKSL